MHKRGCIQLEWAELRDKKLGLVYIESLPKWLVVIRTEGNRSSRLQGLWTLWSMGNTLFPPARNIKKIFLTIVTKCLLRDATQLLYFRGKQLLYRNFCLTFYLNVLICLWGAASSAAAVALPTTADFGSSAAASAAPTPPRPPSLLTTWLC
jgi:hypothetical protein